MNTIINDPNEYINRFSELITQGKQAWINAGKVLADAVDKVPGFTKKLMERHPEFTERFIRKMIDLGRGALHLDLLIGESVGERRLAKLSYSWQEKYTQSPVSLLIKTEKGWDELFVDVRNLTPEQCNQVFTDDGVRSKEQQRAYLESAWAKRIAPPTKSNLPYRIVGNKLVVMTPTQFDRKELAQFLAEME